MAGKTKDRFTLSLFDLPTEPRRLNDVVWSYSRRSTLLRCPQQYYDEYYGSARRSALSESRKDELAFLKDVQNRYQRAGELLHLTIAQYLRRVRKSDIPNEDGLIAWMRRLFAADCEHSESYRPNLVEPSGREYPPVLLREFLYGDSNAGALCADVQERMTEAFHACVNDQKFGRFRAGASTPDAVIERQVSLRSLPCRVEGKVDLAFRTGDRVVIVDWKMGDDASSGEDSLQLAVYALWAVEYFGCDPSVIEVYKAHLGSREVVSFRADERVLAAARARIVQDAMTMASMDGYGADGVAEAFTPCLQPDVCRSCPFTRACPGAMEVFSA